MDTSDTSRAAEGGLAEDPHFLALVSNLHTATFVYLGKIAEPGSDAPARNLLAAKASIDTLRMLRTKTAGNLTGAETRFLDHVIFELQMNYVDEASRPESPDDTDEPGETDEPAPASEEGTPPEETP